MIHRRQVLAASALAPFVSPARPRAQTYAAFLDGVRAEAVGLGLNAGIVSRALSLTTVPNPDVLKRDRHQPEFTLTWAQYRARVLGPTRISGGKAAFAQRQAMLDQIGTRYGVDSRIIVGIWGLESGYGAHMGTFRIVDALATLGFDGRRSAFFRSELLNALRILDHGDIAPEAMMGSYAGAMGQPQFMPSAYLKYAADGDGDGRRDIWRSEPDVFASVANYLSRCGWSASEPWGQPVRVPDTVAQATLGRTQVRPLSAWMAQGVTRADGRPFSRPDVSGAVLRPDGPGGESFMVYRNFNVIRRYNPSDFYALAVGLLGSAVA
ncbi:lytic murein transglycosylase B [Ameyamaea chiangmaiensis NBRC 103196]|uniref:Lytic murein transglycosylase n=1 Tax=Ameyamaea chiangmaiensis TaxID=442969 RepID=A0A850PGD8_9PROT|nr:lytic murein transglycosylase [Ameyamaea chiangmaiensis]MBS4073595.1 lytic murein transglycosylase [Ameyamaea chiangmaiensis]NVN41709.1 lytic murein transglycosylase [Ameyamaea chiangmaiensis]GBQ69135.1 lytic murein transglycosylase B [Ameyamaea chiangmaiensis NBRC 103196]